LIAVAGSFALAHWMMLPIERLSTIAEQITRGDLENVDLSDGLRSRDEIGALAASLERMRSSLKAALSRLAREVS
jgi:HAMP domain-containing protein